MKYPNPFLIPRVGNLLCMSPKPTGGSQKYIDIPYVQEVVTRFIYIVSYFIKWVTLPGHTVDTMGVGKEYIRPLQVIRKFFFNHNKSFRWHLGDYEKHIFFSI